MLLAAIAVLAFLASFVLGLGRKDDQRPAPAADAAPQPIAVPDSRVRVQVLNGSNRSGLARLATDQLRDAGYDVVNIGNAPSPAKTSVVLDRAGKPEIAARVAATLGITRIESRPDTALYLEVTVILGPDFTNKSRPKTS
ncbi:MAG TPA: LytR C-terminal domain-containing protein, partial [Longimicrobiales bacterium]